MATARRIQVMETTGKASAGRGGDGNDRRTTLRAKLALGVATLGCAAALAFGGLQARDADRTQPRPAGPVATGAGQETDQVAWLERFQLARIAAPGQVSDPDQVAWLAGFRTTGQIAPGERHGADQVAWLEQFQLAEAGAPGVGDGGELVAWLERFQLPR